MKDYKKIFNKTAFGENQSEEELLRIWQETQADIPELGDIDISLTDFPTKTEKLAIRRGSSNGSGIFMLALVGLTLLAGTLFTMLTFIAPFDSKRTSEPQVLLNKHKMKQPTAAHQRNIEKQKLSNGSKSKGEQMVQNRKITNSTQEKRYSPVLPKLETLAVQELHFNVNSPSLQVSRYTQDYNYKYMRNYKVYNYENRRVGHNIENESEKLSLDPRFPNWNEYRFYQKNMGMTFREYEELLYKALTYMDKERYREVDLILFSIIKFYPNDQNAWFYSGISSYKQQDYTDALHCFETILNDYPSVFKQEAHWYYALCLLKEHKIEESKMQLLQIVESNGFYKEQAQNLLSGL